MDEIRFQIRANPAAEEEGSGIRVREFDFCSPGIVCICGCVSGSESVVFTLRFLLYNDSVAKQRELSKVKVRFLSSEPFQNY